MTELPKYPVVVDFSCDKCGLWFLHRPEEPQAAWTRVTALLRHLDCDGPLREVGQLLKGPQ